MENTIENKAKFFAQYYGQEIMRWEQWYDTAENSRVGFAPMQSKTGVDKGWYLELTSLSDITDEDAMDLIKIYGTEGDKGYNLKINRQKGLGVGFCFNRYGYLMSFMLLDNGGCINNYYERYPEHQHFSVLEVEGIDLLRSCGYALPWMGVSVEEQIKRGWIRLKTK